MPRRLPKRFTVGNKRRIGYRNAPSYRRATRRAKRIGRSRSPLYQAKRLTRRLWGKL